MQHQGGPRDGYFAWSVDPATGRHNSEGTASDGELYFITDLLFASNRWGNDTGIDYYAEARRILDAMWSKDGSDGINNIINVEHKQISFVPESERYNLTDPSLQNFLYCRGIDTFEDQYNMDGTLPDWILPAGGFRKLRHSLGLVAASAAASLMGTQEKSWKFVDAVWNAKLESYEDGYFDPYYDGFLYLFSLMHLSGNYRIITPSSK